MPLARHCEPVPLSGTVEALAGAQAVPALEARFGGVVRDPEAERRMARLGLQVTRAVRELRGQYRFRMLDSDEVNAVSLPGGYIYITRGLSARLASDDLWAAALAHEMAHLEARDHFKPRCAGSRMALEKELSADARALAILRGSGFSPRALLDLVLLVRDAQPAGWAQTRAANLRVRLHMTYNLAHAAPRSIRLSRR